MDLENVVYVYDKYMNLIAQFDDQTEGYDEVDMQNMMVSPIVHVETNGPSTLTFQMLANCEKWQLIKDPENIYYLNGRYYTPLNEGSYNYTGEGSIRIVNVTLVETWYLLGKQYLQAFNCGIYTLAKCEFRVDVIDGIVVRVTKDNCSVPSNAINSENAFKQVLQWPTRDNDNNLIPYNVIKAKESESNWENPPSSILVFYKEDHPDSGYVDLHITTTEMKKAQDKHEINSNMTYGIMHAPRPAVVDKVYINVTTITEVNNVRSYSTETREATDYQYYPDFGYFRVNDRPSAGETFNYILCEYQYCDFGTPKKGAYITLGFGAEVVDEHTICLLPKADKKYKLTIDGIEYEDSQVKDSRGVVMPRGSAGYAMWAILKNSGWSLGICDVIAKGFNPEEDYGCFNVESDMKDVLSNIKYIQELYGGILDWDSKHKVLNYRAENSEDYQSYNDGFNDWTGYEFRQEKNMRDQPAVVYDNDLITKAYILGYGNLNIKAVNNGKTYLEDYSYTDDVYEGYLEQPLIYDTNDDSGQKQLKYWGQQELHRRSRPRKTVTISANDIRTAQGYEHEVFDLNNVVRVYSKESDSDAETFELQRIIQWEYNAFAVWDSTITLGNKTNNFVEVFKLIYNKAIEEAPQTNASGKIASSEVVLDVDLSKFGIDTGGLGYGGSGVSGSGYGYGTSLSDYIELIVRKTTENSDAVSGLIIDADELHAQTDLFSEFQKQTDDMVSNAYSGLKLYTDSEISSLSLTVNNRINSLRSYTEAGFEAQARQNSAFSRQFTEVNQTIQGVDNKLDTQITAFNEYKQFASTEFAKSVDLTTFIQQTNDKFTQTTASITKLADDTHAEIEAKAEYIMQDTEGKISASEASIKQYANNNFASISLEAEVGDMSSKMNITNNGITIQSKGGIVQGGTKAQIILNTAQTTIEGAYVTLSASRQLRILGTVCSWVSESFVTSVDFENKTVSTGSIYYLGV